MESSRLREERDVLMRQQDGGQQGGDGEGREVKVMREGRVQHRNGVWVEGGRGG